MAFKIWFSIISTVLLDDVSILRKGKTITIVARNILPKALSFFVLFFIYASVTNIFPGKARFPRYVDMLKLDLGAAISVQQ